MNNIPNLIVMLTHNDKTVLNAYDIFEKCKNSKAKFWGFKEEPIPLDEMKRLYSYMKSMDKTTFLEVIAYDELGTEAIRKLEVENLPVVVVIDKDGNNLYETATKEFQCE